MPTTDVRTHNDPKKLFAELSARGIDAEEYTKIKTIVGLVNHDDIAKSIEGLL